MRVVVSSLLVFVAAVAVRPAAAQDFIQPALPPAAPVTLAPPQGPPPGVPASAPRAVQPTPQPGPPPPAGPPIPKRGVNVQIELTITDQMGTAAPDKKTISMIASDSTWGRIRAGANARPSERAGFVATVINVDARPFLLPNQTDVIQLELTIEYKPLRSATATENSITQSEGTNLNQSMSVILQNGKPLQISQAADPVTDRKILVEVKATILK